MSSEIINSSVVFQERVEMREAILDNKGDRTQKESDIWRAGGEAKRKKD